MPMSGSTCEAIRVRDPFSLAHAAVARHGAPVVPTDAARARARNLIVTHTVGVGAPLLTEVVRTMLLIQARRLVAGVNGVPIGTLH